MPSFILATTLTSQVTVGRPDDGGHAVRRGLFRAWNAREAAARAAADSSVAPGDGGYHFRRTARTVTCGAEEETMRRTKEEARVRLDRMLSPD